MSDIKAVNTAETILILGNKDAHNKLDKASLRRLGFSDFVFMSSGAQAAQYLQQHQVKFVLCDRVLDEMTGLDFVRLMRTHPDFQNLLLVLLSTDNTADAVLGARHAGCSGYLIRPYSLATFKRQIEVLLQDGAQATWGKSRHASSPKISKEHFEQTLNIFTHKPEKDENDADSIFERAMSRLSSGRYDEAIAGFEEVLAKDPDYTEAREGLALAWKAKGHPKTYVEGLQNAAQHFLMQGRLEEAEGVFRKLKLHNPNIKDPYQYTASALIRRKDYQGAARVLVVGFDHAPSPNALFDQIARDCYFTDSPMQAAQQLSKELAKVNAKPQAYKLMTRMAGPKQADENPPKEMKTGTFSLFRDALAVAKYTVKAYRRGEATG